jgi:hypothetical protein
MSAQLSVAVRNARLDAIESTIGTSPKLQIFDTNTPPADCAAADTGTKLVEMTLPSDWIAAASGGLKSKLGTWNGTAITPGTAKFFRLKDSSGTTCHIQGVVTITGGGGEITLDIVNITTGTITVTNTFTLNDDNA